MRLGRWHMNAWGLAEPFRLTYYRTVAVRAVVPAPLSSPDKADGDVEQCVVLRGQPLETTSCLAPAEATIFLRSLGNDTLRGLIGPDILRGSLRNDFAYGGVGADGLQGGDDDNQLFGEEGNHNTSAPRATRCSMAVPMTRALGRTRS